MSIKAIIFDYGEVLNVLEDPTADEAQRANLAQRLNLEPDELWSYLFEGDPAKKWMSGQITRGEFWKAVLAPHGITDPAEIAAFAESVFGTRNQINPEMAALAQELKGRYKLAVLSNTGWTEKEMQTKLYNHFGLPEGLFDVIVSSTSAGLVKPDLGIFQLALERLGVRPEEAIFADDIPNFTASAAKLGINTHTFTTPSAFRDYLLEMEVLPSDER